MVANLFDNQSFYFYLTLQAADTVVQLPLPEAFDADSLRRSIDEARLKRFATGVLKTVVVTLPNNGMSTAARYAWSASQPVYPAGTDAEYRR